MVFKKAVNVKRSLAMLGNQNAAKLEAPAENNSEWIVLAGPPGAGYTRDLAPEGDSETAAECAARMQRNMQRKRYALHKLTPAFVEWRARRTAQAQAPRTAQSV